MTRASTLPALWLMACGFASWCQAAPVAPREGDLKFAHLFHRPFPDYDSGTPTNVEAMTQAPNGLLWMGGFGGMAHFDGLSFSYSLPDDSVFGLSQFVRMRADPDESFWLATREGDVIHLKNGRFQRFTRDHGLPGGSSMSLFRDKAGSQWVANRYGLARLEGDRWRIIGPASQQIAGAFSDRDGQIWLAAEGGLFRAQDANAFTRIADLALPAGATAEFAQTAEGSLWIAAGQGGVTQLTGTQAARPQLRRWFYDRAITKLMADRVGNLWMGGTGLHLLSAPRIRTLGLAGEPAPEEFRHRDGLTGDSIRAIYEDRMGLVWIATNSGMDHFFHSEFVGFPLPRDMTGRKTLLAMRDGSLWVADQDAAALVQIRGDTVVKRFDGQRFTAATRDQADRAWFGGPDGVVRIDGDRLVRHPSPPNTDGLPVAAMVADRSGSLWLASSDAGVFALDAGSRWQPRGGLDLPDRPSRAAAVDDAGDLWLAYGTDLLVQVRADGIRSFPIEPDIRVGPISTISADGARLWIGAEDGMLLFEGGKYRRMVIKGCPNFEGMTAVLRTRAGGHWHYRGSHLTHYSQAAIEDFLAGRSDHIRCELYDRSESLPGALQTAPSQPMAESVDDQLWLAAGGKVLRKDLKTPLVVIPAPRPVIMLIGEQSSERSADRNTVLHSPLQDMSFGAGTRMLWFRFSASQLWAPGRLRFRYRLIGIDEEWQITRNNREGRYTQLPPGRYTFEVEAGNSSGVWSAPTQLRFSIQPFFYQSTWFYLLCALLTFGIIALLFQFQLRRVSNRLRSRLSERLVERERIARELHDTLLQGFQGLILRFQGAVSRMTPDQATRGQMESLLDEADRVLVESRDRVSELRQSPYESGELPEAIADVANKLAAGLGIDTSMKVVGDPRDIDIGVHAETFLIAREALSNAIRHSGAKRVLVTLEYERHALRLTIRDDGCGIDEAMLDAGGKPGHWGLQGMRERAQKLRATLLFRHPREGGTEIELRIPANLAFSTAK